LPISSRRVSKTSVFLSLSISSSDISSSEPAAKISWEIILIFSRNKAGSRKKPFRA